MPCTQVKNKPKDTSKDPIDTLYPKANYNALDREMTDEDSEWLRGRLAAMAVPLPLYWLLLPEPSAEENSPTKEDDIIQSDDFMSSTDKFNLFLSV